MHIPLFFRTPTRLLLLQTLIVWFLIRISYLNLPSLVENIITSLLGNYIDTVKDGLDFSAGFVLPYEATFFLPVLLDEYIIRSMPDLAILLGTSPCNHRIARQHPEANVCEPELAYHCYQHGSLQRRRTDGFKAWEACWGDYGIDVATAWRHHDLCHRNDKSEFMGLIACMRAKNWADEKNQVSAATASILACIGEYGMQAQVAPLWKTAEENVAKEKAQQSNEIVKEE